MTALDDCDLLEMVRSSDQQALVALYDRYSGLVYSIGLRILKSPSAAEDVVQEVFMRVWRKPEQIQVSGGVLHGWMIVAARNRSISVLRKRSLDPLDELSLISRDNLHDQTEQRLICEALINQLLPEQRAMMEMAFLKDMTYSEIASATGRPLGTIKSRIRSALMILRKTSILLPETLRSEEDTAPVDVPVPILLPG
jgi:RNA polymerase sigma-70 factor (ECF subfamily)